MSNELKPCPRCGGLAKYFNIAPYGREEPHWIADCAADCPEGRSDGSEAAAAAEWNSRPVEDALRAERDAALAEAARYKALWDAVPWDRLHEATLRLRYYEHQEPNASDECLADGLDAWLAAYAPQPQGEGAQ